VKNYQQAKATVGSWKQGSDSTINADGRREKKLILMDPLKLWSPQKWHPLSLSLEEFTDWKEITWTEIIPVGKRRG
jgi:hypothetical protein